MSTSVEFREEGFVARIVFKGPKGVHTLGAETRKQLGAALDQVEASETCRVVIFEAEGRTFLAGGDLHEIRSLDARTAVPFARAGQALMSRIEDLRPVTIAAVQAACAGGGCELALACDFRMGAKSARIGLPEVTLGLLPGWGGTVRAVRLLGGAAARRLILTGELLKAEDAHALGLVDSVTKDEKFREAVDERAALIVSRAPQAARRVKRLIQSLECKAAERQFRREARRFGACYATGEPAEGMSAFLEKRTPNWDAPG